MTKIKVRKMLAAVLALVFVLSVFASCGKKEKNEPTNAPSESITEPTSEKEYYIPPIEDDEDETKPTEENSTEATTKKQENVTNSTQSNVKPTQNTVKPTQSSVKPTEKPTQTQKPTEAPTQASKNVFKKAYFKASTGEKIEYTSYSYNADINDEHTYTAYEKNGIVYKVDETGYESCVAVKCNKCNSYLNCKCDPYVCGKCGKHNCQSVGNDGECYGCGKYLKSGECHACPNTPDKPCKFCGKSIKYN